MNFVALNTQCIFSAKQFMEIALTSGFTDVTFELMSFSHGLYFSTILTFESRDFIALSNDRYNMNHIKRA